MHDLPRQKLRDLILEYGRSLCDDPRRCEALLKDYCGQYKREIFVLVTALKGGVAAEVLKAPANVPPSLALARVQQRLADETAISPEAVRWAVESWALALGVIAGPAAQPASVLAPPPTRAAETLLGGRYRDHGDGTVTDVQTGLQWMRCSLGQEWRDGTCVGQAEEYQWDEALQAAETLNDQGGYAGYRDWHLPTKDELLTLVRCSSGRPQTWNSTGMPCEGDFSRPAIDQAVFPETPSKWYWSSTPYTPVPALAWGVSFNNGYVDAGGHGYDGRVRLVRSGQ